MMVRELASRILLIELQIHILVISLFYFIGTDMKGQVVKFHEKNPSGVNKTYPNTGSGVDIRSGALEIP